MRLNLLSLLALVAALALGAAHADDASEAKARLSRTFTTTYFIVHYDPSDPYLAQLMARGAAEHLTRIADDLGCKLATNRPFPLYIYPSHMGFIHAGRLEKSKFTLGTAQSNETISVDVSGVYDSADRIMAHEATHAVIFRILGGRAARLPLWANEGLAEYESQEYPDKAQSTAAEAAATGSLIPLRDLDESFPEGRTDLAYAESFLAAKYLVDRYGKSAPRKLLAELVGGRSFDQAMNKTTGISASAFAERWYHATTARFWPLTLSRIGGAVVGAIMAILAVIAFLVRRKQKIEAAKRWEQEEFEETLRRQLRDDWPR